MLRIIIVGFMTMALPLFGMLPSATNSETNLQNQVNMVPPQGSPELYVPENIDVIGCLNSGGKCCYVIHGLCKFGVGACEVASLTLSGLCAAELRDNPGVAMALAIGKHGFKRCWHGVDLRTREN
jgi:hypothetical protein